MRTVAEAPRDSDEHPFHSVNTHNNSVLFRAGNRHNNRDTWYCSYCHSTLHAVHHSIRLLLLVNLHILGLHITHTQLFHLADSNDTHIHLQSHSPFLHIHLLTTLWITSSFHRNRLKGRSHRVRCLVEYLCIVSWTEYEPTGRSIVSRDLPDCSSFLKLEYDSKMNNPNKMDIASLPRLF